MPWFGGGRSEANDVAPEKTDIMTGDDSYSSAPSSFGDDQQGPAVSGNASQAMIQRMVLEEQQKALVQQVVAKLAETSFDQCIDRPQASLSSTQRACVHTVVGKYLDTSEFVVGRTTKVEAGEKLDKELAAAQSSVVRMVELASSVAEKLGRDVSEFRDADVYARTSAEAAAEVQEYYELIESVRKTVRHLESRSTDLEIRRSAQRVIQNMASSKNIVAPSIIRS